MENNKNQPAFPTIEQDTNGLWNTVAGLTKLESFTAMAMQGLCANPEYRYNGKTLSESGETSRALSVEAKAIAEYTLKQLNQE